MMKHQIAIEQKQQLAAVGEEKGRLLLPMKGAASPGLAPPGQLPGGPPREGSPAKQGRSSANQGRRARGRAQSSKAGFRRGHGAPSPLDGCVDESIDGRLRPGTDGSSEPGSTAVRLAGVRNAVLSPAGNESKLAV